ncbi:ABC transporter ATP-binding protein [Candidatus Chloroploca sp. M-50]|uniref:ABC transporter ATP-binding protein n=1 Tax=Candidatus Chloroploca mongolica TaxID=2528176 RepID=A0ABS4DAV2_9CHLR|nr:ABC transporter ATP-binding protein [Candidatus Chloroploca mongolica]MBP1466585.1 ABC transporter ATP-binding protein [Candidatus Chloroploca mongolica]
MPTTIVLEARKLTRIYGERVPVRALNEVDLQIQAGEIVAIVGPSGSGKSTLLNLIGALDRPSSGDVIINGTSLTKVRNLDRFRGETIGFIFQSHNLLPTLTARENVEVPMYESSLRAGQRRARAQELLTMVGLASRINHLPNQLSGGERQRVAVARALANRPAIILADEPTGNLDTKTTADIMALLTTLNREQGTTLIIVTHNSEVAAAAQRVITIRDGQIQRDVLMTNQLERELIELKSSALGQAILRGDPLPPALAEIAGPLHELLEHV